MPDPFDFTLYLHFSQQVGGLMSTMGIREFLQAQVVTRADDRIGLRTFVAHKSPDYISYIKEKAAHPRFRRALRPGFDPEGHVTRELRQWSPLPDGAIDELVRAVVITRLEDRVVLRDWLAGSPETRRASRDMPTPRHYHEATGPNSIKRRHLPPRK